MTAEQRVRAAWQCEISAERFRNPYSGCTGFSIDIDPSSEDGSIGIGIEFHEEFSDEEAAWSAALAYTEERGELIRKAGRAREFLAAMSAALAMDDPNRAALEYAHALVSDKYADLTRGLRPEWVESVLKGAQQ